MAAAAALIALGGAIASGAQTQVKSVVLGKTANYPASGCPDTKTCQVVARVTGIQMKADGVQHPFTSPADGQLVAWWLKLPALHSSQLKSFSGLFGGAPAARIAVLRRGVRSRVRLIRESPTVQLTPFLGKKGRARFRLPQPLRIKQGDYVGLTAVTWIPAFAVGLGPTTDIWLASRPLNRCSTPPSSDPQRFADYYKRTDAQLQPSTVREYHCLYRTARLLYWARIIPDVPLPPSPATGEVPRSPGASG